MRSKRSRRLLGLPSLVRVAAPTLLVGLLACGTLNVSDEMRLGRDVHYDLQQELRFFDDEVTVDYVRDIGESILHAVGPQPFDYRFFVVKNGDINAFAGPAGFIYVNTGTILKARNVSELAGVIGHEIGHVAERHIAENYYRQRGTGIAYQVGIALASLFAGGLGASAAQLGGGLASMAYLNSFGREAEMEADAFAVSALPAAGYDPDGLVTFFETLQNETGGSGPSFLSSHPATEDRIAATRGLIEALPPQPGLVEDDRGKLEIIQRRIQILGGASGSGTRH